MVKIRDKQDLLLVTDTVIENNGDSVTESIKEELDDHRVAINENTTEIEANFEYIRALEQKIEALAKKVVELSALANGKKEQKTFLFSPLSNKEKEVFFVLYSQTQTQPFTTYKELGKKLNMSDSLVANYITNMLEKGIPLVKRYSEGVVFLKLDDEFKELQAKKNLVGVNTLLTCWL